MATQTVGSLFLKGAVFGLACYGLAHVILSAWRAIFGAP